MNIKSFIRRKPWIAILATALVVVLACGAIASFTDTDLAFFAQDLNEDNLLYNTYADLETKTDASGITLKNRDGVLTLNGSIPDSDDASEATFILAKLTLKAGTYTYTCFDKPTANTYYSYIKYTGSDGTHVIFGDFENANITMSGATVDGYKTFTLAQDTEVEIVICVEPGTKCTNVKAYPVLVEGEDEGSFYAEKND